MARHLLAALLIGLLVLLHAQLWLGRGSPLKLQNLRQELQTQQSANQEARRVNEQLSAEVSGLQEGLNMVEERARHELGMVKPGEIFVQIAK